MVIRRGVVVVGAIVAIGAVGGVLVLRSNGSTPQRPLAGTKSLVSKSVANVTPTSSPSQASSTSTTAAPAVTSTTAVSTPTTVASAVVTSPASGPTTAPTTAPTVVTPQISLVSLHGEVALGQSGATEQYLWIYGTNFSNATAVAFGSDVVPIYRLVGNTQIEVGAPLENLGTVDIHVLAGSVSSPTVTADQFTYVPAGQQ